MNNSNGDDLGIPQVDTTQPSTGVDGGSQIPSDGNSLPNAQYDTAQFEPQPDLGSFSGSTLNEVPEPLTLTEVGAGIPSSPFQGQEIPVDQVPQPPAELPTQAPAENVQNVGASPQMAQAQTPSNSPAQPQFITGHPSKSFSKFKIFITVAVVAIVAIYAFVTFLYFQNKKLKENLPEAPAEEETSVEENLTTLPTSVPVPSVNANTVKILNGNVVLQASPDSESKILIDKTNYSSTGITGFARVAVSNDNQMLCFESWPPAPEPALYFSKSDGSEVKEVSPNRQNCLWSKDSSTIYYTDYVSKASSKNIYSYPLSTEVEKNLTLTSQPDSNNRVYELVGLSADGSKLVCKYSEGKATLGVCEIDLSTFEVTFPENE